MKDTGNDKEAFCCSVSCSWWCLLMLLAVLVWFGIVLTAVISRTLFALEASSHFELFFDHISYYKLLDCHVPYSEVPSGRIRYCLRMPVFIDWSLRIPWLSNVWLFFFFCNDVMGYFFEKIKVIFFKDFFLKKIKWSFHKDYIKSC